jgi:hypothetical protein
MIGVNNGRGMAPVQMESIQAQLAALVAVGIPWAHSGIWQFQMKAVRLLWMQTVATPPHKKLQPGFRQLITPMFHTAASFRL